MATILSRLNRKAQQTTETGLGINSSQSGGRFFNKDGSPNIKLKGINFWEGLNLYHELLTMPLWKFIAVIVCFFIGINILFAFIYLLIGLDHLGGLVATTNGEKFGEAFFFSAQTFTTVGYGRINPIGFWASSLAALEALLGLLSFALATGLLYGRFARPKAYISYSKNALIAPFRGGNALMFRIVPYTKNYLTEAEVKVTVAMQVEEDGVLKNQFYNPKLDIAKANTLTLNWTLVHPIDENSPFYNLTKEDIIAAKTEILVFVQGFDESFSSNVVSRGSYSVDEIVFGAKFKLMFEPNEDKTLTILDLNKLNDYELVELPVKI